MFLHEHLLKSIRYQSLPRAPSEETVVNVLVSCIFCGFAFEVAFFFCHYLEHVFPKVYAKFGYNKRIIMQFMFSLTGYEGTNVLPDQVSPAASHDKGGCRSQWLLHDGRGLLWRRTNPNDDAACPNHCVRTVLNSSNPWCTLILLVLITSYFLIKPAYFPFLSNRFERWLKKEFG